MNHFTGAQDYINATPEYHVNAIRPRVQCADGFEISIQASIWHCCQPRVSGFYDYERIEVGYPSAPVPELAQWKTRTFGGVLPDEQSIFTWVPVSEVDRLIAAHGGITDTIGKGLRDYDGEDESPDITHDWGAGFPGNFGELKSIVREYEAQLAAPEDKQDE